MRRGLLTWLRPALAILAGAAALILFRRHLGPAAWMIVSAIVLAFLLEPIARRLESVCSRPAAAGISLLAALLAVGAFLLLLLPPLTRQVSDLAAAIPSMIAGLRGALDHLNNFLREQGFPAVSIPDLSGFAAESARFLMGTVTFAGNLADFASRATMTAILSLFLLGDRDRLLLRLELAVPRSWRTRAVRAGLAVSRELRAYVRGQLMVSALVGAMAAIGLGLVGVRGGLALGVLVGVLNLIPYFGPVLATVPVLAAALLDGWQTALFAGAVLITVQQLDGMLLSPRILGNLTGLSPAVVLISVYVGASAAGIAGMLFALPVLMLVRACVRLLVQQHENV